MTAVVKTPGGRQPGVVRAAPGLGEALAGTVPPGTVVELVDSRMVLERTGMKKWYRIRTVVGGISIDGWMHSDILK
jgi:hypothetical protein